MTERVPAVLFAAVSDKDQVSKKGRDKISIEYQLAEGQKWCDANGYTVVETLIVPGHSRSDPDIFALLEAYEEEGVMAYKRLRELWQEKAFKVLVAYSADRLGRSGTLIHWVMECTIIKYGLQIYLTHDGGMVRRDSIRDKALFSTAAATKPMDSFVDKTREGQRKLTEQGLPTNGRVPSSHIVIRDKSGNIESVAINEEMRPFYTHLKDLLLEGVALQSIGYELYKRHGHLNAEGRYWQSGSLHGVLYNPRVWGHNWTWPRGVGMKHGPTEGNWAFDRDAPPPDGITVYWDAWPAMYEGEEGEKLKAELRRRHTLRGRSEPGNTYRFSQVCVCGGCGGSLSTSVSNGRRVGVICGQATKYDIEGKRLCEQRSNIHAIELEQFLSDYITQLLKRRDQIVTEKQTRTQNKVDADKTIKRLEAQIDRLIQAQSLAPESLQARYRDQLVLLDKQMQSAQNEKDALERAAAQAERMASREASALEAISSETLEKFWQWPDKKINQTLRDLLGNLRLVVLNRKVTGVIFRA